MTTFGDDFDGGDLDLGVWVPAYLPHWSSREASAATYAVGGSCLTLSIPEDAPLWCPEEHAHEPLRVSGVQSGAFSGPVGSTVGQQPFKPGLTVRSEEPARFGWTPHYGRVSVRARMSLSPRSMASVWLIGRETVPEECGEICVFEIFGDALRDGDDGPSAAVGMGVHPFRDPALSDDFDAPRLPIDVSEFHDYAVLWRPGRIDFLVDGTLVRTVDQAPDYPMQAEVAVFDFPSRAASAPTARVPQLVVDRVASEPL